MAAAADGDRDAITPLFHALWPVALDYATRFLGDRALAEDCAQDALVKLFAQVDRFDRTRDALTWVLTHVIWQSRTTRRKVQRRGECAELPGTVSSSVRGQFAGGRAGERLAPGSVREQFAGGRAGELAVDGAVHAEERDLVRAALAALETLSPRDIEIITAAVADDDELRRSLAPATFRKRLERALGRLRTSWRSRHGTL